MVLAVVVVIAASCAYGFRLEWAGTRHFWGVVIGANALVAAAGIAWAVRAGEWHFVLPRWGDITKGFFAAAFLFGISFVLVKIAVSGTPREAWLERIYTQLGDPVVLRERYGKAAAVIVAGAALEEIVWRGFVTTVLEPVLGSRRAWITSAVLYAAAHVPAGIVLGSPALPVAALGVGLAMGALTRMNDGRVPPAIIAHALFDICAAMMFRLVGTSV
jgi:hypothetical protein